MKALVVIAACFLLVSCANAQGYGGGFGGAPAENVSPPPAQPPTGPPVAGVTMDIPAMPVKDAVAKIKAGWQFEGDLGQTVMPGVQLYNFPKNMAAAVTLIAAGLIPPKDGSKLVSETLDGRYLSLFRLFTWDGQTNTALQGREETQPTTGQYPKEPSERPMVTRSVNSLHLPGSPAVIAMAAYKHETTKGDTKLYTVLTKDVPEVQVFRTFLKFAGVNCEIGDLTGQRAVKHVRKNPSGETEVSWTPLENMPPIISAEAYNATLDQTVELLSEVVALTYRKTEVEGKPTYIIECPDMSVKEE